MQTVRPSDFEEAPIEFSDEAICLSKAFQQEPDIQQLGFNLLLDRSGKLLMKKKGVYKKDIVMNPRALAAVMKSSPGRRRYSAHVIAHGILHWYSTTKQLPRGISPNSASVRDWALRTGAALRKLATKMKELCRRTGNSHDKGLQELKQEVLPFLPPKKRGSSTTRNPDADGSDSESSEFEESEDEVESSLSSRVELESLKVLSTLETPEHKRKTSPVQTPSPPKSSDGMSRLKSLIARAKSATEKAEKPDEGSDRIGQVLAKLRASKVEPCNKFVLPGAVLESLKAVASHAAPFLPNKQYKNGDDDDDGEPESQAEEKASGSKKTKRCKRKTKRCKRKGTDAKKGKAMPSDKGESKEGVAYKPGEYKKMRQDFIKAKTQALGVKPREAGRMWNDSAERAALMSTLSRTEQVRRRFLPPLNPRGKRAKKA